MNILPISWYRLALGFLALLLPLAILIYFKTKLTGKFLLAALRMTLQLIFVGIYLEYLFKWDNPWINIGWVGVMVLVSDLATVDRSELKMKPMLVPVFFATLIGMLFVEFFLLRIVVNLKNILTARYLIPVTGMVLGNCLRSNVIGIRAFYHGLKEKRLLYQYYLMAGATRTEALAPFFRDALKEVANPMLATMATIGLVSLPGMMTGQILGGNSPMVAIRYQIMIMIAIITGTISSVSLCIWFVNRKIFDDYDQIKLGMLRG